MIRRTMIAGLAGAGLVAALRPAAAQTSTNPSTLAVSTMSTEQVAQNALSGMAFALASSQLANSQAEASTVKTFATLESEEQMAFAEARGMAGLTRPTPAAMNAEHRTLLQGLQGTRGAEFDRMYLRGQMLGHNELLQLHMAMAKSAATKEERMLGTVAVPAIRSHLAMLQGIQQQMRG